jgi:hypothetical protein
MREISEGLGSAALDMAPVGRSFCCSAIIQLPAPKRAWQRELRSASRSRKAFFGKHGLEALAMRIGG